MKKRALFCLAAVLLLTIVVSMTACTTYRIDTLSANQMIADFFSMMKAADYQSAEELLHPAHKVDLASKMTEVPPEYCIFDIYADSSAGYSYQSKGANAVYDRNYVRTYGNREVIISIGVLLDAEGYGIYDFNIDPVE